MGGNVGPPRHTWGDTWLQKEHLHRLVSAVSRLATLCRSSPRFPQMSVCTYRETQRSASRCRATRRCSGRWCRCDSARRLCWRRRPNAWRKRPQTDCRSGSGTGASALPSCPGTGFCTYAWGTHQVQVKKRSELIFREKKIEFRSKMAKVKVFFRVQCNFSLVTLSSICTWTEPEAWRRRWATLCS